MTKGQSKNFLVTGGAGFIASHVCYRLLSQGHRVLSIDNFDPYYNPELKKQNITWLKTTAEKLGDSSLFFNLETDLTHQGPKAAWEHSEDVKRFANTGLTGVFHLAAKAGVRPSVRAPGDYFLHNVEATRRILEAVTQEFGIKTPVVAASSSSVYGTCEKLPFREEDASGVTLNPYACSKWLCERMVESFCQSVKLRAVTLRFFTVYGPRQRPEMAISKFIRNTLLGQPIEVFGDGKLIRDFTYIDDIVTGTIQSMDWVTDQMPGTYDCFNLGAQRPVMVSEMIDMVENITDKKAKRIPMPRPTEDMAQTAASCDRAKEKFGFSPKTNLEEGLTHSVAWIKKLENLS